MFGSSPRVWGTRFRVSVADVDDRFIPTRVGNTRNLQRRNLRQAVHPHACGEHVPVDEIYVANDGSSPRVWGTRQSSRLPESRTRFIPTRVGNTRHSERQGLLRAVHPHACGEHKEKSHDSVYWYGSSPRVWGTPPITEVTSVEERFIPTRVGNTPSLPTATIHIPVHPHACGEHLSVGRGRCAPGGSSPRVWGTRHPV